MEIEYRNPAEIEKRSFAIITEELGNRTFPEEIALVVKRVIHTTADFDYADNLVFSNDAVSRAMNAIRNGAHIVTDTNMAKAGINKKTLAKFGGEVHCFIAEPDVAAEAKQRNVTRSIVSMERAAKLDVPVIFAIGNAPTALIQLEKLIREDGLKPELVIGVPVGFVNVVESKELIIRSGVPHIVARGRKGGSNVAAAIVNALLYQLVHREGF
ncbi:MAG: precorrin-8X methylmutase [Eubacteriales bacterium]|nr:precorrin-8X methylmutase [Eubacteriales bacterium]